MTIVHGKYVIESLDAWVDPMETESHEPHRSERTRNGAPDLVVPAFECSSRRFPRPSRRRTAHGVCLLHHSSAVRARRASRACGKTLERELASYTTSAEQHELDAILDRAEPEAAVEIRRVISRSRAV